VGHLSKLQDRYREKGLTVIGITGEDRAMNLRYMIHQDPGFTYKVAIGSAPGYETPRFPWSVLVAPDGSIAWQDSPARMNEKKHLRPLLAKVERPSAARIEARTERMLERAEAFVGECLFLRAEAQFEALIRLFPDSDAAATARERMSAVMNDIANGAEIAAQKKIAKLIGGIERPDPEGKRAKNPERTAARLKKLADGWRETAPRSARLADEWAALYLDPWK
jgi:hypothetical protein